MSASSSRSAPTCPGVLSMDASMSVRLLSVTGEVVHDLDDRGAEQHNEQRGEDAPDHGKQHLERRLLALLLSALTAAPADLLGLDAQHVGNAHAELLRLDHGLHEVAQLVHLAARPHVVE